MYNYLKRKTAQNKLEMDFGKFFFWFKEEF